MADHPLSNISAITWFILAFPVIDKSRFVEHRKHCRYWARLISCSFACRENTPSLDETAAWRHAFYLVVTQYPSGFVFFGFFLGMSVTIAAFVTALIALHRRRTWFLTLYAAGLLLNLVIILHISDISDILSKIGIRRGIFDVLPDITLFDVSNFALCLMYWIWITRSRRLQLNLQHRVRLDDPLLRATKLPRTSSAGAHRSSCPRLCPPALGVAESSRRADPRRVRAKGRSGAGGPR